jgi:hypothetical protein
VKPVSRVLALGLVAIAAGLALLIHSLRRDTVGDDPGHSRYSPLDQITVSNVGRLVLAWV